MAFLYFISGLYAFCPSQGFKVRQQGKGEVHYQASPLCIPDMANASDANVLILSVLALIHVPYLGVATPIFICEIESITSL